MSSTTDLSYEEGLMDVDNPLVYSNDSHDHSAVNTSKTDTLMELYDAQNLYKTLEFILLNDPKYKNRGTSNNENILDDCEKQQFAKFGEKFEREQTLIGLISDFNGISNIYLHFIGFMEGNFRIVNEFSLLDKRKRKEQAFVVLNGNKTICGPLFCNDLNGRKQTVFALDDMCIRSQVDKYIEQLNRTNPSLIPLIEAIPIPNVVQDWTSNILVDDVSALVNHLNASGALVRPESEMEICSVDDKILRKIVQTKKASSIIGGSYPDTANESERVDQAAQIPITASLPASTHLSNTTKVSRIEYEAPPIVIEPKPYWKGRYPKDLIPKAVKKTKENPGKKQTDNEKKRKYIGLLQGIGDQRSQIQVKIPPGKTRQMFLACAVRTVNNERHALKVIVQKQTKVNQDRFNRENDLNYFEFDECNPMHFFDPDTRIVYMVITAEEHEKKLKEVPVYMLNLYQNQRLTKDMIEQKQLDKCRLAFWLCVKENENYISVSTESLSHRITERKDKKNNRPP